jgi:hypothetical protein
MKFGIHGSRCQRMIGARQHRPGFLDVRQNRFVLRWWLRLGDRRLEAQRRHGEQSAQSSEPR